MDLPKRKKMRLSDYNYSSNGIYFLTFCTMNRKQLLSNILEDQITKEVNVEYSNIGTIVSNVIIEAGDFYNNINIDNFVVMPNHVHILLAVECEIEKDSGKNSIVSSFISTIKRFTNKKAGISLWQNSYHDHIVRNVNDYSEIWEYIENNPLKWQLDKYYSDI